MLETNLLLGQNIPRNRFLFLIKHYGSDDCNKFWVRYSHEGSLQHGFDRISFICMSCFKLMFLQKLRYKKAILLFHMGFTIQHGLGG